MQIMQIVYSGYKSIFLKKFTFRSLISNFLPVFNDSTKARYLTKTIVQISLDCWYKYTIQLHIGRTLYVVVCSFWIFWCFSVGGKKGIQLINHLLYYLVSVFIEFLLFKVTNVAKHLLGFLIKLSEEYETNGWPKGVHFNQRVYLRWMRRGPWS